jgi:DNA-binding response OmpR family regulator
MNLNPTAAMQNVQAAGPLPLGEVTMPHRILIIEDGPVLAKNMKSYLSRGSCEVRTAADAAQAYKMLDSFAPDTLILDYGLPDVDGLKTYAEIVRRQSQKIEGVMITGDSSAQLAQDAHDLGIHHVICKPFRFSDLQRLLEMPAAAPADAALEAGK